MTHFSILIALLWVGVGLAEEDPEEYLKALEETQAVLTTPQLRTQAATTPEAKAALDSVSQLTGTPENEQALFNVASQIFGNLTKDAQGDPDKLEKILLEAQKNPESFFNKLTPQQQNEIQGLAKKIPEPKRGTGALP